MKRSLAPLLTLACVPASDAGPGGLENNSGSAGAVASPAALVAVSTVKSMCELDGVVELQDHRLHTGEVPAAQLLE